MIRPDRNIGNFSILDLIRNRSEIDYRRNVGFSPGKDGSLIRQSKSECGTRLDIHDLGKLLFGDIHHVIARRDVLLGSIRVGQINREEDRSDGYQQETGNKDDHACNRKTVMQKAAQHLPSWADNLFFCQLIYFPARKQQTVEPRSDNGKYRFFIHGQPSSLADPDTRIHNAVCKVTNQNSKQVDNAEKQVDGNRQFIVEHIQGSYVQRAHS